MEISQKIFELEAVCSKFLKSHKINDRVLGDYNCTKYHLDVNAVTRVIAVLKVASELRVVSKEENTLLNEMIGKLLEIKTLWQKEDLSNILKIREEARTFDLAFINNCIDFFNNAISHLECSDSISPVGSPLKGMTLQRKKLKPPKPQTKKIYINSIYV